MVKRNTNMAKLTAGYLFPEINRRKREFLQKNPGAQIISLGIGNTTEPLTPHVVEGLRKEVDRLSTREGYSGYGDEQGINEFRAQLAEKLYGGLVKGDEVFISDGAKCDIARLQTMFGSEVAIAVQDPSYPVYVDGSVIAGVTGYYNDARSQFDNIVYMKCCLENDFFPDLSSQQRTDLIYFCSPNNPTGAVASKKQLSELVEFARKNRSIIIFDSAYSEYITDPSLPKSIYEIDGAREVAIEVSSFSKPVGFTGVRLGWTVVPDQLKFDDGTPVRNDWNRIMTTLFNGASNIAQYGGMAALEDKGLAEMRSLITYYMDNAKIIKQALDKKGIKSCGGVNAPYVWAHFPGRKSWEVFTEILEKCQIVTTPGAGFGPAGEGFIRFSAFGHREDFIEAVKRLELF
ncbi:MAG: LL-diaminopimelate aminotransferase [Candidatus Riflebacteria bacterium HGW-Riflebacteria-1]|jgi:LL-diaminopimelate aminotransferase|nr:MAG: LL-diaminopimelate aminotransferase [Candidatus Riflebacteria bacterium HGW-Riflebacteria-1]